MVVTVDPQLADAASFIFEGTVLSTGQSTVSILSGRSSLAVARFERGFRINPLLGDLRTRPITVGIMPGSAVREGERLVFFANSWVHAEGVAVMSLAQAPVNERTQAELEAALKALPALHLERRVASAQLVVQGQVESVRPAELRQPLSEHMATWMRAHIAVRSVIKGDADSKSLSEVFFPENTDSRWQEWPKLKRGQRGVFLFRAPRRGPVPAGGLVLPDPLDVQPVSSAKAVRALASAVPSEGSSR